MVKLIADCGLPVKIQTEWTETEYQDYDEFDYMRSTTVAGWRVRINGKIYPRGPVEGGWLRGLVLQIHTTSGTNRSG